MRRRAAVYVFRLQMAAPLRRRTLSLAGPAVLPLPGASRDAQDGTLEQWARAGPRVQRAPRLLALAHIKPTLTAGHTDRSAATGYLPQPSGFTSYSRAGPARDRSRPAVICA
jgi:hypothetical protein